MAMEVMERKKSLTRRSPKKWKSLQKRTKERSPRMIPLTRARKSPTMMPSQNPAQTSKPCKSDLHEPFLNLCRDGAASPPKDAKVSQKKGDKDVSGFRASGFGTPLTMSRLPQTKLEPRIRYWKMMKRAERQRACQRRPRSMAQSTPQGPRRARSQLMRRTRMMRAIRKRSKQQSLGQIQLIDSSMPYQHGPGREQHNHCIEHTHTIRPLQGGANSFKQTQTFWVSLPQSSLA